MNVDLLSDVLRVVRLDGAFFYRVEATAPWCVESRTPTELRPRVLPASEHLVAYHVLVEGECWAGLHGGEQTRMRSGDVVVFPLGSPHRMSSARGLGDALVSTELPDATPLPFTMRMGGGGEHREVRCGFLGCDRGPFNPLLGALPVQLVVPRRGDELARRVDASHALAESESSRAGSELVITRLAEELMFIEVLRRHVESLPPQSTGWLAGLRDPLVGRALALLHGAPAREWSLQELAEESATSRTVLAELFGELVGLAPMQYLARWRMQLAAERLDHSTDKLATIAQSVGYASEAAFSRAFRKLVGASPSHWRARRTRVGAPDG